MQKCKGAIAVAFIIIILGVGLGSPGWAADPTDNAKEEEVKVKERKPYYIRLTYYADTRSNNTLNILYGTKNLPFGLEIFGFTDLHSEQIASQRADLTTFFTELRLTRLFSTPVGAIGVQAEYNDQSGTGNDHARFGIVYHPRLDWMPTGWWSLGTPKIKLRGHPLDTDPEVAQVSVIWSTKIFHPKLIFEGFADYNINYASGGAENWVVEPQLRFMFFKNIGLVYEFRFNQFYRFSGKRTTGHAFGLTILF